MPVAPPCRADASRFALGAVCASLLFLAGAASAQTTTFEARVIASLDDVEQFADSSMYVNSSDLELIHDTSDQTVGIRWTGLTIPPGATITTAWIQFAAKETWPDVTSLNFYGQAADAAPQFTTARYNVGSRPRTSAFVNWVPVVWTAGEVTANERTPDLKSVVQEIVSRPGWASGNPLVVIINGTGHRTAWAWDGNAALAPLLHIEYTTGAPPVDQPPVGNLAVSQAASPPLTVNASAAGSTDTDATPIASYSFDWGDGSQATVVNAPTQTATHTYGSTGTYTVTLVATDTGNLASTPVTKSITLTSDQPPLAQLAVTQASSPPLTVSASAAASTDGDATPIASYSFNWGDGSQPTVVSAPAQTATHTYGSAGTYTVTLVATDTGNLASAPVTQSITVSSSSGGGSVVVYVGYYDTHHAGYPQPKPSPWQGSAGVVFVGKDDDGKGNWDSAALRVDNPTGSSISVTVTCDIGSNHYALWGARTIPAGGRLIMAQTAFQNFDGSDTSPAGCYGCNPNLCLTKVVNTVGVVHVTIGSTTTNYYDNTQVLNTRGVDGAGCPYTNSRNDESQQWKQIGTTPSQAALTGGSDSGWMPAGSEEKALALTPPVPNPARGMLLLRFGMARGGPMQLAVYDLGGRRVRTCLDTELDAGVYEKSVDLTGMRPGMYYAELRTTYGSIHRSFVVTL